MVKEEKKSAVLCSTRSRKLLIILAQVSKEKTK